MHKDFWMESPQEPGTFYFNLLYCCARCCLFFRYSGSISGYEIIQVMPIIMTSKLMDLKIVGTMGLTGKMM